MDEAARTAPESSPTVGEDPDAPTDGTAAVGRKRDAAQGMDNCITKRSDWKAISYRPRFTYRYPVSLPTGDRDQHPTTNGGTNPHLHDATNPYTHRDMPDEYPEGGDVYATGATPPLSDLHPRVSYNPWGRMRLAWRGCAMGHRDTDRGTEAVKGGR